MMSQLRRFIQVAPNPQMMAAPAPQTSSWKLDVRISEERMITLDPPGSAPWRIPNHAVRIWTMDAAGIVDPRWQWPDCTTWTDAVAFRMEDQFGNEIPASAMKYRDDGFDW